MKKTTVLLMALGLALPAMSLAQDSDSRPPREGRPQVREGGGPRGPMVPPLVGALDANKDGVIDADEIKNAAEALKKLDKNNDGKLTPEELRPARPEGRPNEDGREGFAPPRRNGPPQN